MEKEIEKMVKDTVKKVICRERSSEEALEKLREDLGKIDATENVEAEK